MTGSGRASSAASITSCDGAMIADDDLDHGLAAHPLHDAAGLRPEPDALSEAVTPALGAPQLPADPRGIEKQRPGEQAQDGAGMTVALLRG